MKNNRFLLHFSRTDDLGVKHTFLPFIARLIELWPSNTEEFTFRSESRMTDDMEGTLVVTQ